MGGGKQTAAPATLIIVQHRREELKRCMLPP
jgi:hypothetical protein